jgi:hypothetical protein
MQHARRQRGRILATAAILLVLAPIVCCAGSQYVDNNLSAVAYLSRLVGASTRGLSLPDVRTRLLQRVPRGTPEAEVYTFLEANGVERDQLAGGQSMRYQPKNDFNTILGLLSDPPYRLELFCGGGGYIIRFQLDAQNRLEDIMVESTAVCL